MRFSENSHGLESLRERIAYAGNGHHPNHEGIVIIGPHCVNCDSADDFLVRIDNAKDQFQRQNPGKPGPKPKAGVEVVLASKRSAHLLPGEEAKLVGAVLGPFRGFPFVWWAHRNKSSGRTDFHIMGGNFPLSEPREYRLSRFGNGKKNYTFDMQRLVEDTLVEINAGRAADTLAAAEPLEYWTDSVLANRLLRKWVPLGLQLFFLGDSVTPENIDSLIEGLGHKVIKHTRGDHKLCVQFRRQRTASTFDRHRVLQEAVRPLVPQFRYIPKDQKYPLQIQRARQILDQWRDRVSAMQRSRNARSR